MVEDASARADGGDAEAPAEAPRLKHTRSSRRRLERVWDSGGCEPCYKYDNLLACYDDGLPRGGDLDCVSCCFAGGDDEAAGAVGGLPNRRMAAYSARWAHAEVFDKLSESSSTAPVTIELDYYKCKMKLREVVEIGLGWDEGLCPAWAGMRGRVRPGLG